MHFIFHFFHVTSSSLTLSWASMPLFSPLPCASFLKCASSNRTAKPNHLFMERFRTLWENSLTSFPYFFKGKNHGNNKTGVLSPHSFMLASCNHLSPLLHLYVFYIDHKLSEKSPHLTNCV